jgi:hypothetical protein
MNRMSPIHSLLAQLKVTWTKSRKLSPEPRPAGRKDLAAGALPAALMRGVELSVHGANDGRGKPGHRGETDSSTVRKSSQIRARMSRTK